VGGLMYLVDTNVWIELLLEQEKSNDVKKFFQEVETRQLYITEFSLYSIGIILTKLNKDDVFHDFISDIIEESNVRLIRLNTFDLKYIIDIHKEFHLDFDDAYQYVASEKYNLVLVSFDRDFDNTPRGRKEPGEVLK
jgi:predicted nucleic acid-binding protein